MNQAELVLYMLTWSRLYSDDDHGELHTRCTRQVCRFRGEAFTPEHSRMFLEQVRA